MSDAKVKLSCPHFQVSAKSTTKPLIEGRCAEVGVCSTCGEIVARVVHENGVELSLWERVG